MLKDEEYQKERNKLLEIFKDIEPNKQKLVYGLINDAAFLYSENIILRNNMSVTGMVKIHPNHPEVQKTTESSKQYLKNVNTYSVIIKTLSGILSKDGIENDDAFDNYLKKQVT